MSARDIDDIPVEQQGRAYLDRFDSLKLDEKIGRRIAVLVLDEFFRRTMADVGREYLGFSGATKKASVSVLWRKTLGRLETLEAFDEPTQFSEYIKQLHQFRNNVAHNTDDNPPQSNLEDIRADAMDWFDWLLNHAHQYDAKHEQTPPRELMIEMTKRSLDKILAEKEMIEDLNDRLIGLQREAEDLYDELAALESEQDEITVDLIDLLVEAMEIAQAFEKLQRMEAEFWRQVEIEMDEQRLQGPPDGN